MTIKIKLMSPACLDGDACWRDLSRSAGAVLAQPTKGSWPLLWCHVEHSEWTGASGPSQCSCLLQPLVPRPQFKRPCMKIDLPLECPDDGLELLLNFFYTGELQLDDSNLEKIQNAASGLSVPDSLIPCQSLPGVENLQSPVLSEDDKDKPLFPLTSADAQSDHTPKGKTRSWQRMKNKPDACRVGSEVTAGDDDPPASTSTTTTRSGRRVKGPNRLVGESPMATVMRQGAGRRKQSSLKTKSRRLLPRSTEITSNIKTRVRLRYSVHPYSTKRHFSIQII